MISIEVSWARIIASDGFSQISTTGKKVKTKECHEEGRFPVVDQGQGAVAGYVNDADKVINASNPLIVFGDHTRAIKWIDFSFVPGADGTKILKPNAYLDPRFAYYQLRSLEIPDKGYSRHFKFLKELDFLIPPLAEQKAIAEKLDTLLAQVESTKARLERIPKILKRFRQSVLAAAVSGKLTEEWRKSNDTQFPYKERYLSEIILEMRNGLSPKPNEDGRGKPILRISSVRPFSVDQADIRFLEVSDKDEERYSLVPGDLLFTRYNGSLDFVGVCALVRRVDHRALLYPDKLIRVRADRAKVTPEYIEIFSASHKARDYIYSLVKSTSGQKGISGKDLKMMEVNLPSINEQAEIVRRVDQLFAYADTIETQVSNAMERVNSLTQSILAKAFRGELTEQWRKDNPDLITGENSAEALLEKIKAERAAANLVKRGRKKTK